MRDKETRMSMILTGQQSTNSGRAFAVSARGKALITVFVFAVMVGWCVLRSYYVDSGKDGLADNVIPVGIRFTVLILLSAPALFFLVCRAPLAWLVGLSAAVGTLPGLPLLPFLRDYVHLVTFPWFITIFLSFLQRQQRVTTPLYAVLFIAYVAMCAISLLLNYLAYHNIWQAKVGVSFLILFIPTAFIIFALATDVDETASDFDQLLDGFVWGVFAQAVIAMVALPLLVYLPYAEGNDTLFGLGYYYRYKSTFSGPVSLSFFFLASIPMLLLWLYRTGRSNWWAAFAYLQIAPWMLMATASRTARVAALIPLALLLANIKTRRYMFIMLPSAILAYWVAFSYVSLPSALSVLVGKHVDPSMDMSDRFFASTDRAELVKETASEILRSPIVVQLIGQGPGVGGYSESGFPAPHNMLMNLWVESGAIGVIFFVGFLIALFWSILRAAMSDKQDNPVAWLTMTTLASFILANAAYQTTYWGYALVLAFFAICAARLCKSKAIE